MEFNDEQLPNENSMRLLQKGYANKVKTLQDEEPAQTTQDTSIVLDTISNNIDWQGNTQLLNILQNRANNRCMRNYIRGLIVLNEQDRNEINGFYTNNGVRRNPNLINNFPTTFNTALRDYIRNEAQLLDDLLQLLQNETNKTTKTSIYNIIRRRLDALDTLASFMSNGIFN